MESWINGQTVLGHGWSHGVTYPPQQTSSSFILLSLSTTPFPPTIMSVSPTAVAILGHDNLGPLIMACLGPDDLANAYSVAKLFSKPRNNRSQHLPQRGARIARTRLQRSHNIIIQPDPRDDEITTFGKCFCHSGRIEFVGHQRYRHNDTWDRHIPWDKFCRGYVHRENAADVTVRCFDCTWGKDRVVRRAQYKTIWSWRRHQNAAHDFP